MVELAKNWFVLSYGTLFVKRIFIFWPTWTSSSAKNKIQKHYRKVDYFKYFHYYQEVSKSNWRDFCVFTNVFYAGVYTNYNSHPPPGAKEWKNWIKCRNEKREKGKSGKVRELGGKLGIKGIRGENNENPPLLTYLLSDPDLWGFFIQDTDLAD